MVLEVVKRLVTYPAEGGCKQAMPAKRSMPDTVAVPVCSKPCPAMQLLAQTLIISARVEGDDEDKEEGERRQDLDWLLLEER